MVKIIFEADDNRKGIIDKLFVNNDQEVKANDKLTSVVTQNKIYEIKAPMAGIIKNILVYENKVINSGDVLLEIQDADSPHVLNNESSTTQGTYGVYNQPSVNNRYNNERNPYQQNDNKKSETELFREELIETLLSREVASDKSTDEGDTTIELGNENLNQNEMTKMTFENSEPPVPSQDLTSELLTDIINNEEFAAELEAFEFNLDNVKNSLLNVENELNNKASQQEIINNIANLAPEPSVEKKHLLNDQISDTTIHCVYEDIQNELNKESNEQEIIGDTSPAENLHVDQTIYFDEELDVEDPSINFEPQELADDLFPTNHSEVLDNTEINQDNNDNTTSIANLNENEDSQHANEILADVTENAADELPTPPNGEEENSQINVVKLTDESINKQQQIMNSKRNIAHGFIDVEVDVSELVNLLAIMREPYLQQNINLTLMPFYVKAVHDGLKKFPLFNARYDRETNAVVFKWFYNIAVSVDNINTMKMPILHNITDESVKEIAIKLSDLIDRTVNENSRGNEYQDSTFSIVNFGEYGITRGTVTIPESQIASIGMGIIFKKPVVVEKNDIAIRDIMMITLGYDESVINITEASKFIHYVAYLLSNPGLLL
ncbi:hypothetical protein P344_05865 [Spiroplasma mirum ATCC 29335]|uniref:Dihydrolipoamide acetyltransferase component of pyruvate dehydrogenase complex n=1 Tax=Spiroplasma mirum ATCC 29335 TaxID=838561 RepID=W0GS23_9MOLU|nr:MULTISPECIES: 2-oxo acid dehydrogenase subunit E2 [Spiroplasma]AHF61356.1 putative dihydrolipoamide acetyltransferase [Spiroplasma mirum ATCC 29335]AHI58480.1 hypothetical protein P344_05865 [Spiroplasma mirum ATCC 29335]AKM53407.1 dihydrolipoamide acetyltransferase [Spiroplasma atrichopogonis]